MMATELIKVNSGHDMSCGHSEPSHDYNAYNAFPLESFNKNYTFTLKSNDQAIVEENNILQDVENYFYIIFFRKEIGQ